MGLYSRRIFPLVCDLALGQEYVAVHRRELLAGASGNILEIGFGTGLNLECYREDVKKITVIEPNPGMQRRAQKRLASSGVEVERHVGYGEALPFEDASFDCVISTFTLCSVHDPVRTLEEAARVLRPGGRFLFLE